MKRNVIVFLLTLGTLNLFAKTPTGDRVDPRIVSKFQQDFGSSLNATWKIVEGISIATFSEGGEVKDVYYYESGDILGMGQNVRRDALPSNVKRSINNKFDGGVIQTVYEFKETGSPTRYFVTVVTPRYSAIVSANEFGQVDVRQKIKNKPTFVSVR